MNLRLKFNLVMVIGLLIGFVFIFWFYRSHVFDELSQQMNDHAQMVHDVAAASMKYTELELKPILGELTSRDKFFPQSVPAYAASRLFENLTTVQAHVSFKTAILNAEVERYEPAVWEAEMIQLLISESSDSTYIITRGGAQGRYLVYAKPISRDGQIIGAHIATVQETLYHERAQSKITRFMWMLLLVLFALIIIFNLLLHSLVIKPVKRLSDQADQISKGDLSVEELASNGSDEVAQLAKSFNRMLRSLKTAMNMLGQKL